MKPMALILLILLASSELLAQSFQPISVPVGMAEKIIVRGYKGKLQIEESSGSDLQVEGRKVGGGRFDQWKFQVRKKQNNLEVIVKGPSDAEDWEKVRAQTDIPAFEIKIIAPKRPMEIFWAEGSVVAKKWTSSLKLQMTEGDVSFEKGEGTLMAQLIKGRLRVNEHQGNVDIQTFSGTVFLEKIKGAVSVNNHSATYSITDQEGPFDFRNHSGSVVFKNVKGHVALKNVSGTISLTALNGSFEGDLDKGAINVVATQLQSFVVNSKNAPITLDAPKTSGAQVRLRSEKGRLRAPPHLRKVRKGRWTELVGRLKGDEQGEIKIISKYGDIMLK